MSCTRKSTKLYAKARLHNHLIFMLDRVSQIKIHFIIHISKNELANIYMREKDNEEYKEEIAKVLIHSIFSISICIYTFSEAMV